MFIHSRWLVHTFSLFSIIFITVHFSPLSTDENAACGNIITGAFPSLGLLENHTPFIARLTFQFFYKLSTYR